MHTRMTESGWSWLPSHQRLGLKNSSKSLLWSCWYISHKESHCQLKEFAHRDPFLSSRDGSVHWFFSFAYRFYLQKSQYWAQCLFIYSEWGKERSFSCWQGREILLLICWTHNFLLGRPQGLSCWFWDLIFLAWGQASFWNSCILPHSALCFLLGPKKKIVLLLGSRRSNAICSWDKSWASFWWSRV